MEMMIKITPTLEDWEDYLIDTYSMLGVVLGT